MLTELKDRMYNGVRMLSTRTRDQGCTFWTSSCVNGDGRMPKWCGGTLRTSLVGAGFKHMLQRGQQLVRMCSVDRKQSTAERSDGTHWQDVAMRPPTPIRG